jgi:hypothetical protein
MSMVDPAGEARGGGSFQRENLSDLDDVASAGAWHLVGLDYNEGAGVGQNKWTAECSMPIPAFALGAVAQVGAGATFVLTAGSTDARGALSITTGTGTLAAGSLGSLTFGQSMPVGKTPFVDIQETNAAARSLLAYPSAMVATGFNVTFASAATASTTYTFIYKVEG